MIPQGRVKHRYEHHGRNRSQAGMNQVNLGTGTRLAWEQGLGWRGNRTRLAWKQGLGWHGNSNIENRRVYCNFLFTEYTHHRICIKCLPLYTAKLFHMQG